jgi:hypothetical protein
MLYTDSITNQDELFSGANPAEAFEVIDRKEEKAKLLDTMLDAASYMNANSKFKDYLCMQLHDVVAQYNKYTIIKILNLGADIMVKDANQCLPLEVAIANKNSKSLIITKHVQKYYISKVFSLG